MNFWSPSLLKDTVEKNTHKIENEHIVEIYNNSNKVNSDSARYYINVRFIVIDIMLNQDNKFFQISLKSAALFSLSCHCNHLNPNQPTSMTRICKCFPCSGFVWRTFRSRAAQYLWTIKSCAIKRLICLKATISKSLPADFMCGVLCKWHCNTKPGKKQAVNKLVQIPTDSDLT